MNQQLATYCIYTIRQRDFLDENAEKTDLEIPEGRPWITGRQLWQEAQEANLAMPVLFADAADTSGLLYWGLLKQVSVAGETTKYTVDQLRRFKLHHLAQELVLRSTDQNIAPNFIRPYAICYTPKFMEEETQADVIS